MGRGAWALPLVAPREIKNIVARGGYPLVNTASARCYICLTGCGAGEREVSLLRAEVVLTVWRGECEGEGSPTPEKGYIHLWSERETEHALVMGWVVRCVRFCGAMVFVVFGDGIQMSTGTGGTHLQSGIRENGERPLSTFERRRSRRGSRFCGFNIGGKEESSSYSNHLRRSFLTFCYN